MLKNLSQELNIQNENLKNISKYFETISSIVKNTENKEFLTDVKNILKDLKPVLVDLENNFTDLENSLSTKDVIFTNSNEEEICDNNTLLISELQNKVFLPYTVRDLQKVLRRNKKYKDLKEVIDKVYTVPMDNYKYASSSRFKEAYILMRKREKASVVESFSLALEVSFNSALNPAIITACKNLDELDTYLDCLAENEPHKFNLFDIKYEMLPQKQIAIKV